MNRKRRLQSAPTFIREYRGKNLVRGYSRWYGVDRRCAIIELKMLGMKLDPEYVAAVSTMYRIREQRAQENRSRAAEFEDLEDSDDDIPF